MSAQTDIGSTGLVNPTDYATAEIVYNPTGNQAPILFMARGYSDSAGKELRDTICRLLEDSKTASLYRIVVPKYSAALLRKVENDRKQQGDPFAPDRVAARNRDVLMCAKGVLETLEISIPGVFVNMIAASVGASVAIYLSEMLQTTQVPVNCMFLHAPDPIFDIDVFATKASVLIHWKIGDPVIPCITYMPKAHIQFANAAKSKAVIHRGIDHKPIYEEILSFAETECTF